MYVAVLICGIVGLLMFFMAYLIWAKKKLFLIAGYNDDKFGGDKEKLGKVMGIYSIIIGIVIFPLPFAVEYIGTYFINLFIIFISVSTIPLVIYINILNRKKVN